MIRDYQYEQSEASHPKKKSTVISILVMWSHALKSHALVPCVHASQTCSHCRHCHPAAPPPRCNVQQNQQQQPQTNHNRSNKHSAGRQTSGKNTDTLAMTTPMGHGTRRAKADAVDAVSENDDTTGVGDKNGKDTAGQRGHHQQNGEHDSGNLLTADTQAKFRLQHHAWLETVRTCVCQHNWQSKKRVTTLCNRTAEGTAPPDSDHCEHDTQNEPSSWCKKWSNQPTTLMQRTCCASGQLTTNRQVAELQGARLRSVRT